MAIDPSINIAGIGLQPRYPSGQGLGPMAGLGTQMGLQNPNFYGYQSAASPNPILTGPPQIPGAPSAATNNLDGMGARASQAFEGFKQRVNLLGQDIQQGAGDVNARLQALPQEAKTGLSRTARYAPGAAVAVGQFGQGNIMEGLGATAGTALAGKLLKGVATKNPLLGGALMVGGSLLGSEVGAGIGHAVSGIGGQLAGGIGRLMGGSQQAVQDAAGAVAGAQRESGSAAGTGAQANITSDKALAQRVALMREMGVNIPNEYLTQNYQITQKYRNSDVNRQMQLNQQNAILTGQLNQQMIAGQLAAGASNNAAQLTGQILGSNPYRDSVLNTGNIRGIA
jgi:hypothetical protein